MNITGLRLFALSLCCVFLQSAGFAEESRGIQDAAPAATDGAARSEPGIARNPAWATPVDRSINLFRVDENFFRSAQLEKKDVPVLKALNIRKVVNLRAFHSDRDVLKNTGIKSVQIGVYTWNITDENVIDALRAIRAAQAEGPVLLHCWHGADRTGLVAAMYRILYQGWTREAALDELLNGNFGYHSMWKNIPEYLQNVDIEKIRNAVERTAG